MAPNISISDNQKMTTKQKNKMRKPVVEKMRRDRINSSIDQLKALLEQVFHKQQQSSVKLEKADILEMTVTYLKQQRLHTKSDHSEHHDIQMDYKNGYSRCFQEALDFLNLNQNHPQTDVNLISHFQSKKSPNSLSSSTVPYSQSKQADMITNPRLWRPW
ncbi:hypothetical protein GDO86_012677 [Hymenochirus boettgeri]|uniref:Transcription factor HES-5 n=1 Tax=Hymenochirus boettgeri TaxID=247094 RepID=A0A8T2ITK6_9PIPI|nr:hypothetical protein GDO86_012677 [Hymenochirus boettgeri]